VAAGLVWTIGQNGTLYGLDPATGRVRQQASIGAPANHFPTPSVGDGLLLAPSAEHVVAFTASARATATARPAATPSAAATTPPGSRSAAAGGGAIPAGTIAGIVGALVVIGGAGWLLWRRRTGGSG
jgi:hypothetical protein